MCAQTTVKCSDCRHQGENAYNFSLLSSYCPTLELQYSSRTVPERIPRVPGDTNILMHKNCDAFYFVRFCFFVIYEKNFNFGTKLLVFGGKLWPVSRWIYLGRVFLSSVNPTSGLQLAVVMVHGHLPNHGKPLPSACVGGTFGPPGFLS